MQSDAQHTLSNLYNALGMTSCAHQAHAAHAQGVESMHLTGITADSRAAAPGCVFVAVKGVSVDGHDFISKAVEQGAAVVVCERMPDCADGRVVWITVNDSVDALGRLADWWYDHPSARLTLVGVTGTNGKTTTATLLFEMARLFGLKAGLISTVANRINDRVIPATHTTPDTLTLHRLMAEMVAEGCTHCFMEVSSHACHQRRITGLSFAGGIFTNLTRDHLDYHKTFEHYRDSKKSFFDSLGAEAFALVNADDRNGSVMVQNCRALRRTYSVQSPADYCVRIVESRLDGMTLAFDGTEVETSFVGRFNASNLAAVYGASLLLGFDRDEVLRNISRLVPVSGRMQTLHSPDGVTAIVDYAHTPDALANVLRTIRQAAPGARVITVTGAGGDRDKGKRPLMGAEAAAASHIVIFTSDNPRHEDAATIASEMIAGVPADTSARILTILDRREAIRRAVELASPADVVLIAGKGHETYQIIGDTSHHFDDCEEVAAAFALRRPQRLVVIGAGESGAGAAVLGKVKGFDVFVTDMGKIADKYRDMLDAEGIAWEEGRHTPELILNADLVVKSPGVPPTAPMVKAIAEKGIPIISEIEFAGRYTDARMVCITGSNGKTTTTLLIHHILKEAGLNVGLAGNVGNSLALQVAREHHDVYVIELSSFQLENMYDFRANIAVLLNITPDHLDRYDHKMQNYVNAKFRILRNMGAGDAFIYWQDDPVINAQLERMEVEASRYPFAETREEDTAAYIDAQNNLIINTPGHSMSMPRADLSLCGLHNLYNSMAAGLSASLLDISNEKIRRSLADFRSVEHRLEPVETIDGVTYINDSKATNVNSTWYALESMTAPTVLILGGKDKGNDYSEILPLVREKVKAIVAMGVDNTKIVDFFSGEVPVADTHSLADAIDACRQYAADGDTVLLSPCCASFDLFSSYEDRGRKFKASVRSLSHKS